MTETRFNIADFQLKQTSRPSPCLQVWLDDNLLCCIYYDEEYQEAVSLFKYLTQIYLHEKLQSPRAETDKEHYRWKLMHRDSKEFKKWQDIYQQAAYTLKRYENRKNYKGLLVIGGKEIRFPN